MTSRSEWEARVSEWRASGLTAEKFCEGRDFKRTALYWWSGRGSRNGEARPAAVSLARVETKRASMLELTIELGGARIIVPHDFDEATLARVVRVLSSSR